MNHEGPETGPTLDQRGYDRMQCDQYREAIATWAARTRLVKRIWIFGSRVRNDHHADSDLDIAIELDMSATTGADDSGGFATWSLEVDRWQPQLQALVGLDVDLELFCGDSTPRLQRALQRSSALIYTKSDE